jgi:hypothetical protein
MNRTISCKINMINLLVSLGILFPILLFSTGHLSHTTDPGMDLTGIFRNQLVMDTNNDHIPDDITARFLIGGREAAEDIEAAAAIAARLGFESSAMNPSLCVYSWEEAQKKRIQWLIIFTATKPEADKKAKEHSGIKVYKTKGIKVIEIFGPTPQARRYAAVNFFARFPYTWDITGRETGELWDHVKKDTLSQLPVPTRKNTSVRITAVHYRYRKN